MGAVKPWEETWCSDADAVELVGHEEPYGDVVEGRIAHFFGGTDFERAKLAACAPEMARMLLALEWDAGERDECPECGGVKGVGHASTALWPDPAEPCKLDALLRKAGVR